MRRSTVWCNRRRQPAWRERKVSARPDAGRLTDLIRRRLCRHGGATERAGGGGRRSGLLPHLPAQSFQAIDSDRTGKADAGFPIVKTLPVELLDQALKRALLLRRQVL